MRKPHIILPSFSALAHPHPHTISTRETQRPVARSAEAMVGAAPQPGRNDVQWWILMIGYEYNPMISLKIWVYNKSMGYTYLYLGYLIDFSLAISSVTKEYNYRNVVHGHMLGIQWQFQYWIVVLSIVKRDSNSVRSIGFQQLIMIKPSVQINIIKYHYQKPWLNLVNKQTVSTGDLC